MSGDIGYTMDRNAADRELLVAAAAGDHAAFDILAARHQGLVRSACSRQGMSAELDDCSQAVFLVLLRKAQEAQRAPSLAAWLLTVTRYVCATARRSAMARQHAEHRAVQDRRTITPDSTPDDPAIEHLDDCLSLLPAGQRTVIAMHFLAGTSRDQVADQLGIGVDAVHQHCHRGLIRLRELLRRRGVVVPATGLLAVLTAQAHAAQAPASAIPALAGTTASAYATGATHAMFIATTAPLSLAAAALNLVTGVAAVGLVSAEPPTPPPQPAAPVASILPNAPSPAESGRARVMAALATSVTVMFQDARLDTLDAIGPFQLGRDFFIDPQLLATHRLPLNMSPGDMRIENILRWIGWQTNTHAEIRGGSIVFASGAPKDRPATPEDGRWRDAIMLKLKQPISCQFEDVPLDDAAMFLRQASGASIIVVSIDGGTPPPVTIKVKDMALGDVLNYIAHLVDGHLVVQDQAIGIFTHGSAPGSAPAPQRPAAVKPGANDF